MYFEDFSAKYFNDVQINRKSFVRTVNQIIK